MSGAARRLTGLTGLKVAEEPHKKYLPVLDIEMASPQRKNSKLVNLYDRTLRVLSRMPPDAGYRVNTQAIIKNRLQMVQTESDLNTLERKINSGKIEEVIRQAERELHLARNMLQYKPWEPLIAQPPKNQFQWPPS